jgi:hypothetical protein
VRLVAIHNRALTADQVKQNFDVGVGEKYFLLFNVSDHVGKPDAYIVFEVSQFDSYSYLFRAPFFLMLDGTATPGSIPIAGLRIGVNGREAVVGQAFKNLNTTITDAAYTPSGRQDLSTLGTVIALEKGPTLDEFFLTFEVLGNATHAVVEISPPPPPPPQYVEHDPEVGIRDFAEINATMSNFTGVPTTQAQVKATYDAVFQALPVATGIQGFPVLATDGYHPAGNFLLQRAGGRHRHDRARDLLQRLQRRRVADGDCLRHARQEEPGDRSVAQQHVADVERQLATRSGCDQKRGQRTHRPSHELRLYRSELHQGSRQGRVRSGARQRRDAGSVTGRMHEEEDPSWQDARTFDVTTTPFGIRIIRDRKRAASSCQQGFVFGSGLVLGGATLTLGSGKAARPIWTRASRCYWEMRDQDERSSQDSVHLLRPRRRRQHGRFERADWQTGWAARLSVDGGLRKARSSRRHDAAHD